MPSTWMLETDRVVQGADVTTNMRRKGVGKMRNDQCVRVFASPILLLLLAVSLFDFPHSTVYRRRDNLLNRYSHALFLSDQSHTFRKLIITHFTDTHGS